MVPIAPGKNAASMLIAGLEDKDLDRDGQKRLKLLKERL